MDALDRASGVPNFCDCTRPGPKEFAAAMIVQLSAEESRYWRVPNSVAPLPVQASHHPIKHGQPTTLLQSTSVSYVPKATSPVRFHKLDVRFGNTVGPVGSTRWNELLPCRGLSSSCAVVHLS